MAASDPSEIPTGVPQDRVDALYGLPIDEFTPARDALAAELRKAGEREHAAWVKALRKPSAAAWLVNQLARSQKREAGRLVKAGEKLRAAHEGLLAGTGGGDELRAAGEEANEAERALLASAPGLLDRDGHAPSGSTLEKARQTLRGVVLDERVRDEFVAGRLTRELSASGFGPVGEGAPAAAGRPKGRKKATTARPGEERKRQAGARAAARRTLKEAKAEERVRSREVGAERELEQARREAEHAQRRLEDATTALEAARAAEVQAQARVTEAAAAVDKAS